MPTFFTPQNIAFTVNFLVLHKHLGIESQAPISNIDDPKTQYRFLLFSIIR